MEGPEEEAVLRAFLSMDGEASSRSARATRPVPQTPPGGSAACQRKHKIRVAAAHHLSGTVPLFRNTSVVI